MRKCPPGPAGARVREWQCAPRHRHVAVRRPVAADMLVQRWNRARGLGADKQACCADRTGSEKKVFAEEAPRRAHDAVVVEADDRHGITASDALLDRHHAVQRQDLDMTGRLGHGEIVPVEAVLGSAVETVERLPSDGGRHTAPVDFVADDVPIHGQIYGARRESSGPRLLDADATRSVVLRGEDVLGDGGGAEDFTDARIVPPSRRIDLPRKDAFEQFAARFHDDRVEDERASTDSRAARDERITEITVRLKAGHYERTVSPGARCVRQQSLDVCKCANGGQAPSSRVRVGAKCSGWANETAEEFVISSGQSH